MPNELSWTIVDQAAKELGASADARLKWRQEGRGVPPAWRIRIAEKLSESCGQVNMAAFDVLPTTPGRIAA